MISCSEEELFCRIVSAASIAAMLVVPSVPDRHLAGMLEGVRVFFFMPRMKVGPGLDGS